MSEGEWRRRGGGRRRRRKRQWKEEDKVHEGIGEARSQRRGESKRRMGE